MRRPQAGRLLALVVGAGLLLCPPAGAAGRAGDGTSRDAAGRPHAEREALAVLARAARAGQALAYTGTQYVASWGADSGATVLEVAHTPGRAVAVSAPPTAGGTAAAPVATAALDPRLLEALAGAYDLVLSGDGRCAGRSASVVEARRPAGEVAGRFWVDHDSGLLLRREVYDEQGRRVRSSAFVDLDVPAVAPPPGAAPTTPPAPVQRPGRYAVDALRAGGWHVPERLPSGLQLLETRLVEPEPAEQVLHLSYTDGLSTLSLFAQRGGLGSAPPEGFVADEVAGRPVWVRHAAPERVVWTGQGRVWTLVSDAPAETVQAAVAALPRDPAAPDEGLRSRFLRGAKRLGSLLNPFD